MDSNSGVTHPGVRIKHEVIPKGMSVTEAARLLGVGRPALSNLLNGNAALSPDMAVRLEQAFKYPRKELLEMQARFDASMAEQRDAPATARAYVPPFLKVKANDIEHWVTRNIVARTRLAVFLRMLVHSTGRSLTKVDFPGNDDAENPGWDGFVEAAEGSPWIPTGRSGWEFGSNEGPKAKAEGDYKKSVAASNLKERSAITFVFVTPRRWSGKASWIADKKAEKKWKDVRAYDASDLEQWVEQSLPGQVWFANETNTNAEHVRSLDKCWLDWATVTMPPLDGTLFGSAIAAAKRTVLSRLAKPAERPILIAADSTEEALAFLAQLLSENGGAELATYRNRVIVFDKPGVLARIAAGAETLIPVAFTREVESELAPFASTTHSFIIYPRNAVPSAPDVILEPATYEVFHSALKEMGKNRDEASRLANASGRSLTVLRRQLSNVPATKTPAWAVDPTTSSDLIPFLWVGGWDSNNKADKSALSQLAGALSYDDLEKRCQALVQLYDAPIWSIGTYRGVVSKIDMLFAINRAITIADLELYFLWLTSFLARTTHLSISPRIDDGRHPSTVSHVSFRRGFEKGFLKH
jgi:addiction module HigA family antidote